MSTLTDTIAADRELAAIETAPDDTTAEQHLTAALAYGATRSQCRRAWERRRNQAHIATAYRAPAQPRDERVTRCVTGKLRYPSREQAGAALNALLHLRAIRGQTERFEQRAYPCDRCNGGWHLTSKPTAEEDVA